MSAEEGVCLTFLDFHPNLFFLRLLDSSHLNSINLFNISGVFMSLLCFLVVLVFKMFDCSSQLVDHQKLRVISLNQDLVLRTW